MTDNNAKGGNSLFRGTAAFVFALSIFVAASLSFLIEPLIGKIFLPLLGGSPNVWNTCVLFFQVVLLLGYVYAHFLTTKLSRKLQLIVHFLVIWLPVLTLPLSVPKGAPSNDHPIMWLLSALLSIVGSVFFAATTTNPLLQKWYSGSDFFLSKDPYFLYAASNAGSLVGLLSYPFWIEPVSTIAQQTNLVSTCYFLYAGLITVCILLVSKARMDDRQETQASPPATESKAADATSLEAADGSANHDATTDRPGLRHYGRWLLLTALPSSLMLGITTYITQELSPFPLLWIIPLSIYLFSFIIAFSRIPRAVIRFLVGLAPLLVLATLTLMTSDTAIIQTSSAGSTVNDKISLHLVTLFVLCTACHGLLAIERPAPAYLTHYYLTISVGGVIGSSFNTLLAPAMFNVWIEYPLALCLAGIALAVWPDSPRLRALLKMKDYDAKTTKMMYILIPVFVVEACFVADLLKYCMFMSSYQKVDFGNLSIDFVFQFLIPIGVCFLMSRSTPQMRLGLAAMAVCILLRVSTRDPNVVSKARNFFGISRISIEHNYNICYFFSGTTVHGAESLDPHKRGVPKTYFAREGPVGDVMDAFNPADAESPLPVGVLGLGAGSLAAYSPKGQKLFLYEIDPAVIEYAKNPFFFTYLFLAKERGVDYQLIQGDGRLKVAEAPDNSFKLLIIDVFSSDAIPTHIITVEAMKLYLSKLRSDGVIAVHISNRYFNLRPVLARAAQELGVHAIVREKEADKGYVSTWVLLSKNQGDLDPLVQEKGWKPLESTPNFRLWTDDYSSPLTVRKANFS